MISNREEAIELLLAMADTAKEIAGLMKGEAVTLQGASCGETAAQHPQLNTAVSSRWTWTPAQRAISPRWRSG